MSHKQDGRCVRPWNRRILETSRIQCAFTLVELCVALALASLMIGSVARVMFTDGRMQSGLEHRIFALLMAEDLLGERLRPPPEGVVPVPRSRVAGFYWVRRNLETVRQMSDEQPAPAWLDAGERFLKMFSAELVPTRDGRPGSFVARVRWRGRAPAVLEREARWGG